VRGAIGAYAGPAVQSAASGPTDATPTAGPTQSKADILAAAQAQAKLDKKRHDRRQAVVDIENAARTEQQQQAYLAWINSAPLDVHELLTMTFPDLDQLASDAIGDNFNWALDEQWRAKLGGGRPEMASPTNPNAPDVDRIRKVDADAEWWNAVFGPPVFGNQLYQESQPAEPGAKPALKLTKTLAENNRLAKLQAYLKNVLAKSAAFQHQHYLAAAQAHFTAQPRLLRWKTSAPAPGPAQAFYDLLTQLQLDGGPSIAMFLASAARDADLNSAALRMISRFAGIFAALDPTGAFEQKFRFHALYCQIALMVPHAKSTEGDELDAIVLEVVQQAQAPGESEFLQALNMLSQYATKGAQGLQKLVAVLRQNVLTNALATAEDEAEGKLDYVGKFLTGVKSGVANALENEADWLKQNPGADTMLKAVAGLAAGFAMYSSVKSLLGWTQVSSAHRAEIVIGTAQNVVGALSSGLGVAKNLTTLLTTDLKQGLALARGVLQKQFESAMSLAHVEEPLARAAPELEKANALLAPDAFLGRVGKVGDALIEKGMSLDLAFDGLDVIGRALGPIASAGAAIGAPRGEGFCGAGAHRERRRADALRLQGFRQQQPSLFLFEADGIYGLSLGTASFAQFPLSPGDIRVRKAPQF
jgi:hypothetical protein